MGKGYSHNLGKITEYMNFVQISLVALITDSKSLSSLQVLVSDFSNVKRCHGSVSSFQTHIYTYMVK